ncbi:hypothetical protein Pmani_035333 [Petrolisthes manimaculis]|uniref:Uncharacterized protein n=1 Tax=Petrolisthes manimaculis TaxID=1843537 RepID=A0AAE1NMJ4_9EUCA|nr:hypothetical protein Pmani_035333 [Petrolisthes manimaculis]
MILSTCSFLARNFGKEARVKELPSSSKMVMLEYQMRATNCEALKPVVNNCRRPIEARLVLPHRRRQRVFNTYHNAHSTTSFSGISPVWGHTNGDTADDCGIRETEDITD